MSISNCKINSSLFKLNFDQSFKYLYNNLNEMNTLSSMLLKLVEFNSGHFFTVLSTNANLKNVYNFEEGGVTSSARKEVKAILLKELHSDNNLNCVFDDINSDYDVSDLENHDSFFNTCGSFYKTENYYIVTQKNVTEKLIADCLYVSNAVYHSLCVLSKINFENKITRELTLVDIQDICKNAQLIVIGAYDAESYLFWEKNK